MRLARASCVVFYLKSPYAVLRRLTVVAVRPSARHLEGPNVNLPPSHSRIPSARALLLCSFLLPNRPNGLNIIVSKSELLWALTCATSNFPPSFIFRNFLFALIFLWIFLSAVFGSSCSSAVLFLADAVLFLVSLQLASSALVFRFSLFLSCFSPDVFFSVVFVFVFCVVFSVFRFFLAVLV